MAWHDALLIWVGLTLGVLGIYAACLFVYYALKHHFRVRRIVRAACK